MSNTSTALTILKYPNTNRSLLFGGRIPFCNLSGLLLRVEKKRGKNLKVDLLLHNMSSLASLISSVKAKTASNVHLKNSVKRKSPASKYDILSIHLHFKTTKQYYIELNQDKLKRK